jgi:hypothetical protein
MNPLSTPVRIAIFVLAVVCTAGLAYAAVKGMQWVFSYIGNFRQGEEHPMLRVVGGVVIAIVIGLRFYVSRRAKAALTNKKRQAK